MGGFLQKKKKEEKGNKPCFTGTVSDELEASLWQTLGFCLLCFLLLFFLRSPLYLVVGQEGNVEVQAVPSLEENTVFLFGVHCHEATGLR